MLAEIYAWFTEGFDTSDLKRAKALLQELEDDANRSEPLVASVQRDVQPQNSLAHKFVKAHG
jgi:hypothetical protein